VRLILLAEFLYPDPEYLVFLQVIFNNKVSGLPINKFTRKMEAFGPSKTCDSHISDYTVSYSRRAKPKFASF